MNNNLPQDVLAKLNGKSIDEIAAQVRYKNWQGNVGVRTIIPLETFYGKTEYHPEEQWLLKVRDVDKKDYRTYALKYVEEWII